MKEEKIFGRIFFLAVVFTMLLAMPALAEEERLDLYIPVTIRTSGNGPQSLTYQVKLEAENQAPLPEQTELKTEMSDTATLEFGPITYVRPGIYHYRIQQVMEDQKYFTFDTRVYAVTVGVLRNSDGKLSAEIVAAIGSGDGSKAGEIAFENSYRKSGSGDDDWDPDPTPTVSPSPEPIPTKVSPERKNDSENGDNSDGTIAVPTPEIPEEGSSVADAENSKNINGSPKTGDNSRTAMWLAMGAGSAVLLIVMIVLKRRSEEEDT